jgi:hypothetical protein
MRVSYDDFAEYLEYLAREGDRIWVAPMGEVLRYSIERESARLVSQSGGIRLVLPDSLDIALYDYPLMLETRVPADWKFVRITQSGRQRIMAVARDDTIAYIRYEVIPETEPVVVEQAGMVVEEAMTIDSLATLTSATLTFADAKDLQRCKTVEGSWEVADGVLSSGEGEWTCKLLLYENFIFGDIQVTGRFKILSGGETQSSFSYAGGYVRAGKCLPGENNGIYYELDNHSSISDFRSNRVLLWHQWTPRDEQEIPWYWPDRAVASFPADISVDEWHSFELTVRDREILYVLDGNPVLFYDELDIPRGRFGLMNRGSRVLFDDIAIYGIR